MRTALDLALHALHLCGAYSPGQDIPSDKINTAIDWLKLTLDEFSSSNVNIPFRKFITFKTEAAKPTYTFGYVNSDIITPPISLLEWCELAYPATFEYNRKIHVLTPQQVRNRDNFTVYQSIPTYCFLDRKRNISSITFYPTPNQEYEINVSVKVALDTENMINNEPLDFLPPYAEKYIIYEVASTLSSVIRSGQLWDDKLEQKRQDLKLQAESNVELDLSIHQFDDVAAYRNNNYDVFSGTNI